MVVPVVPHGLSFGIGTQMAVPEFPFRKGRRVFVKALAADLHQGRIPPPYRLEENRKLRLLLDEVHPALSRRSELGLRDVMRDVHREADGVEPVLP